MQKKNNKKGFTLAELLIVVAIIAVLVAIAIPVFSAQLEKSREATDLANIRSAYAEVVAKALTEDVDTTATVTLKQQEDNWKSPAEVAGTTLPDSVAKKGGTVDVVYTSSTGKITIGGVEVKGAIADTTTTP